MGSASAKSTQQLALRQVECQQDATGDNAQVTEIDLLTWLTSPQATEALDRARASRAPGTDPDPLGGITMLRRAFPMLTPDQCALAMTQAELGERAIRRYGIDDRLFFTRDGLEQATRPLLAARRASLIAASGAARVADLTAGLGFDTLAMTRAGLAVTAVERSPQTAVLLAANVPAARVIVGDATDAGILHAVHTNSHFHAWIRARTRTRESKRARRSGPSSNE